VRRLVVVWCAFVVLLVACSGGGGDDSNDSGSSASGSSEATTTSAAAQGTSTALTSGPMTGVITVSSPSQSNCIGSGEAAGFTNAAEVTVTGDGAKVGHAVLAADGAADGASCTYKFGITSLDWTAKTYVVTIGQWKLERSGDDLQKDSFAIHEAIG
jgi:hypothetical protein